MIFLLFCFYVNFPRFYATRIRVDPDPQHWGVGRGNVCRPIFVYFLGTRCSLLRSLNNDEDIELYTPDFSKHTVQLLMYLLYTGTTNVNQV